ncbi:hypothetical protein [Sphingomonas koreensis]|uniref:hypothetical protein n=1 Tax=Sphingomonas koreensis TaxID=93064 RepID=UPI000F7E8BCD|nr:hypothetical protein [Sphingomonas koreensis]RSU21216.1 hypothetical protein CA224_06855 [Sphingomonas koreensis]RSU32219.1 hypothetical protein CA225_02630 [Sphingomonas koreensis]RSU35713.1 hypothetical protein BRX39_08800 [Sphingomonas koreensis]RSU49884.1 hypothetical protein CA221_12420 [Sphingomonas koreensis]RSU83481.1 hypothetical protein CA253_21280 [Sphingomonas koreensis]
MLSFDDVQERLVEAIRVLWRQPDRERAWLTVRAYWPDIQRHTALGDYDDRGGEGSSSDVKLRPAALTRAEVADAEEALAWLDAVEPDDRKLIGLAISALASGRRAIPWGRLLRPMGKARGVDGLRRRYERALGGVCRRVNGSFPGSTLVNPDNQQN